MESDVARHLQEECTRLGLTQGEFAARIGVSRGAVSRWEKGRHRPNADVLVRLGRLSGASLDSHESATGTSADDAVQALQRRISNRPRLRFRPIEEPRRRLSDLLEASVTCAVQSGKRDLADQIRPILDRSLEVNRHHPNRRGPDDHASH
ncbi:MAG: XRE family transcriptional regulator [Alphaproteobacteria bacterium]|nr:XRE family transcriptional regulator [Alphaproteobacteria bacterium]